MSLLTLKLPGGTVDSRWCLTCLDGVDLASVLILLNAKVREFVPLQLVTDDRATA